MFLPFGGLQAHPAEAVEADRALHVGAARLEFLYLSLAFEIRALFATPPPKQGHQRLCRKFILFFDLVCLLTLRILLHQVYPVNIASFERVHPIFTIKAKVEIAVLTPSRVLFPLDLSNSPTVLIRTPPHVIHVSNSVKQRKLFILLQHLLVESKALHI